MCRHFSDVSADSAAEAIQYGHRDILCDAITGLTGSALVNAYEKYVNNYFYGVMVRARTVLIVAASHWLACGGGGGGAPVVHLSCE